MGFGVLSILLLAFSPRSKGEPSSLAERLGEGRELLDSFLTWLPDWLGLVWPKVLGL